MSRFAVAEMRKHGSGSIVNLASIIGLVGYAQGISDGFNPYPHAKGGVVQMTRDMSIALAEAKQMGLSLPGLALVHQLYLAVQAQGHGQAGTHALILALEQMSGLVEKS